MQRNGQKDEFLGSFIVEMRLFFAKTGIVMAAEWRADFVFSLVSVSFTFHSGCTQCALTNPWRIVCELCANLG